MSAPRSRPDDRSVRSIALGILIRVERDLAHAAPLLDARGAALPPRDRELLRALVKRTLRGAIRLDHVLARHLDRPLARLDVEVRAALRLGAAQLLLLDRIPAHAAVAETVAALKVLSPRASGLVNAVLRRVGALEERPGLVKLAEDADEVARLALESSHPEWLVRRWIRGLGLEPARRALAHDDEDSPVDLLMDPRAGDPEALADELSLGGVVTVASEWAPLARTVVTGNAVGHPLVSSGKLAVVDVAAQAMVECVPAADVVVDLTAAPGGKTRTLLARARARRVLALERQPARARRLHAGLVAAGREGQALVVRADAARPPLPRGTFGSVLLDAPCSGTGTLRKNPEIRLRLDEESLAGFARVQRGLLDAGLDLVSAGGTLVYVTCSLEPEENEDVVDAVLSRRDDAARTPPRLLPPRLSRFLTKSGALRVPPGATNDGFSLITIERARQVR